jgi:hypothetical protein
LGVGAVDATLGSVTAAPGGEGGHLWTALPVSYTQYVYGAAYREGYACVMVAAGSLSLKIRGERASERFLWTTPCKAHTVYL